MRFTCRLNWLVVWFVVVNQFSIGRNAVISSTRAPSKSSLDCDFESGFCNWTATQFQLDVPGSIQECLAPSEDHTRHSADGHFIYSFYSGNQIDYLSLQASNPYAVNQRICFTFAYYYVSLTNCDFTLNLNGANASKHLFHGFAHTWRKWQETEVEVMLDRAYQYFRFDVAERQGTFSLDDIQVRDGPCTGSIVHNHHFCDFELAQTCMFDPSQGNGSSWAIHQASEFNLTDHSSHTASGHFFGIHLTDNSNQMIVLTRPLNGNQCLRFSYWIAGNVTLYYSIAQANQDEPLKPKWKVSSSTLGLWFTHQTMIYNVLGSFRIVFGIESDHMAGSVFIDDVTLGDFHCDSSTKCDFETRDTCTMEVLGSTQSPLNKSIVEQLTKRPRFTSLTLDHLTGYITRPWQVHSKSQERSSIFYCAKFYRNDHTSNSPTGNFLALDLRGDFERGVVLTERYSLASSTRICLRFAYLLNPTFSVLEVYLGESSRESDGLKLWDDRHFDGVSNWKEAQITAKARYTNSSDLYFYFIGSVMNYGYTLLDDFSVTPGSCPPPSSPFSCGDDKHKQVPPNKVCNWVTDCTNGHDEQFCGSCNFINSDLCHYEIESWQSDYFEFQFSSTSRIGPKQGPGKDSGIIVASRQHPELYNPLAYSQLISPLLQATHQDCQLQFYYQYFSNRTENVDLSHAMNVKIYMIEIDQEISIWQSSAQVLPEAEWQAVKFTLGGIDHAFQVIFEAHTHSSMNSYHALSSIKLDNCQPLKPSNNCYVGHFECNNHVCIESTQVCDLTNNCGDGSDELKCDIRLMVNFESGIGMWGDVYHSSGWVVQQASHFEDLRLAPTFDHTTGFTGGSYLFFKPKRNQQSVVILDSPAFVTEGNCKLRLYVLKNSADIDVVIQYWNIEANQREILTNINQYDNLIQFKRYEVMVPFHANQTAKILIIGNLTQANNGFVEPYLAIDDVSLSPQCHYRTYQIPTTTSRPNNSTPKPKSPSKVTTIVLAVMVPVFVLLVIAGSFFAYKRYTTPKKNRNHSSKPVKMSQVEQSVTN